MKRVTLISAILVSRIKCSTALFWVPNRFVKVAPGSHGTPLTRTAKATHFGLITFGPRKRRVLPHHLQVGVALTFAQTSTNWSILCSPPSRSVLSFRRAIRHARTGPLASFSRWNFGLIGYTAFFRPPSPRPAYDWKIVRTIARSTGTTKSVSAPEALPALYSRLADTTLLSKISFFCKAPSARPCTFREFSWRVRDRPPPRPRIISVPNVIGPNSPPIRTAPFNR